MELCLGTLTACREPKMLQNMLHPTLSHAYAVTSNLSKNSHGQTGLVGNCKAEGPLSSHVLHSALSSVVMLGPGLVNTGVQLAGRPYPRD